MMQPRWWPTPSGEEVLCHIAQLPKAAVPTFSNCASWTATSPLFEEEVPPTQPHTLLCPHLDCPQISQHWLGDLYLTLSLPCLSSLTLISSWPGLWFPPSLFFPIPAEASSQPVTMFPPLAALMPRKMLRQQSSLEQFHEPQSQFMDQHFLVCR